MESAEEKLAEKVFVVVLAAALGKRFALSACQESSYPLMVLADSEEFLRENVMTDQSAAFVAGAGIELRLGNATIKTSTGWKKPPGGIQVYISRSLVLCECAVPDGEWDGAPPFSAAEGTEAVSPWFDAVEPPGQLKPPPPDQPGGQFGVILGQFGGARYVLLTGDGYGVLHVVEFEPDGRNPEEIRDVTPHVLLPGLPARVSTVSGMSELVGWLTYSGTGGSGAPPIRVSPQLLFSPANFPDEVWERAVPVGRSLN